MDRKWKIISLGSQGLNRIYDPDGKDVTSFIKKAVCVLVGDKEGVSRVGHLSDGDPDVGKFGVD